MKKILFLSLFWVFVWACNGRASDEKNTGGNNTGERVIGGEVGSGKLLARQPADEGFVITGKVKSPMGKAKIRLGRIEGNKLVPVDSVSLDKNKTFTFKGKVAEQDFYVLDFYNTQKVLLVLDNKPVTVEVDGNKPTGAVVMKGTPAMEDMQKLSNWLSGIQEKMGVLQKEMQAAALNKSESGRKAVEKKVAAMRTENTRQFKDILSQMQPSLAVWYALNNGMLNPEEEYAFLMPLVANLQKAMPQSKYAPEFATYAAQLELLGKAVKEGQDAPEITLNNADGKPVKLSSLRGKYVLIDFWASWCGPCRQENPNVVRTYNKFKGKNFEIYGVSLDRDRDAWLKAIEKDQLAWIHVSDLKFWNSEGAQTYGVRGIPATFLVDPKGKIIAKNLRGEALDYKLTEIFGAK